MKPLPTKAADFVWREPDGTPVSCLEKLKVLEENLVEIQGMPRTPSRTPCSWAAMKFRCGRYCGRSPTASTNPLPIEATPG